MSFEGIGALAGGLVVGGAATATSLWLLSGLVASFPLHWRMVIIVTGAALVILRDWKFAHFPLPQNARQIPRSVLGKGRIKGPFQFGFELGTGVRTYLTSTTPYLVALVTWLLVPSMVSALAVGIAFGVGRAIMPVLRYRANNGEVWDLLLEQGNDALVRLSSTAVVATALTYMASF